LSLDYLGLCLRIHFCSLLQQRLDFLDTLGSAAGKASTADLITQANMLFARSSLSTDWIQILSPAVKKSKSLIIAKFHHAFLENPIEGSVVNVVNGCLNPFKAALIWSLVEFDKLDLKIAKRVKSYFSFEDIKSLRLGNFSSELLNDYEINYCLLSSLSSVSNPLDELQQEFKQIMICREFDLVQWFISARRVKEKYQLIKSIIDNTNTLESVVTLTDIKQDHKIK
jgi:hypothetical protein